MPSGLGQAETAGLKHDIVLEIYGIPVVCIQSSLLAACESVLLLQ